MGKALITNKIYLSGLSKEEFEDITATLTYKIPKAFNPNANRFSNKVPVEIIRNYSLLPKGVLAIPQPRVDLIPVNCEIVDKRVQKLHDFPEPKYPLYDNQKVIYDQVEDNVIINAAPGWGKTFTAIYLACKLKQKTLIIVHTLFLRDQWVSSIKDLLGIDCSVISSGKIDYSSLITVANVQTLNKNLDKVCKEFGTVIVDEMHHLPSTTLTNTVTAFHARYKIGLSGTLKRKDGKHILFKDAFGSKVLIAQGNVMIPSVKMIDSGFATDASLGWADRVTKLLSNFNYQNFIADLAKVFMAEGHCVLILGDRVEFLDTVGELIGSECVVITGITKDREEIIDKVMNGQYNCISASTKIFSEGISVNRLSCVILANPINNDALLEQIIGRIQRFFEGKLPPLVVDIQFSGYGDNKQNTSRNGFYMRKGWQIESI